MYAPHHSLFKRNSSRGSNL